MGGRRFGRRRGNKSTRGWASRLFLVGNSLRLPPLGTQAHLCSLRLLHAPSRSTTALSTPTLTSPYLTLSPCLPIRPALPVAAAQTPAAAPILTPVGLAAAVPPVLHCPPAPAHLQPRSLRAAHRFVPPSAPQTILRNPLPSLGFLVCAPGSWLEAQRAPSRAKTYYQGVAHTTHPLQCSLTRASKVSSLRTGSRRPRRHQPTAPILLRPLT